MADNIQNYDLASLLNYAGYYPGAAAGEVVRRGKGALSNLVAPAKELMVDAPTRYWVEEPNEIAYAAQKRAAVEFGVDDTEWNKSDAVKHMVWQNELARRTMLPQEAAGKLANLVGLAKEAGDQFSATGGYRENSLMDLNNNMYGANKIPLKGDNVKAAIEAARIAPKSLRGAIMYGLPYARD